MIQAIKSIDSFGIFQGFTRQPDTPAFVRFNFVYGWNYSGKSTLSRVLRCLEENQNHPDYPDGKATVVMADGTEHTCGVQPFPTPLRVFNEDYVRKTIRWDEHEGVEPLFMIGEQSIQLEEQLEKKRELIQILTGKALEATTEAHTSDDNLEARLTQAARPIRSTWPGMSNFDKTPFRDLVSKADILRDRLSKADQATEWKKFTSTDRLDSLTPLENLVVPVSDQGQGVAAPDPMEQLRQIAGVLGKVVTVDVLDRLKDDPDLSDWVLKGITFHETKSHCQFCGGLLPPDFLTGLRRHFSDAYTSHLKEIESGLEVATSLTYKLPPSPLAPVYSDLRSRLKDAQEQLEKQAALWNSEVKAFTDALLEKQKNPLVPIKPPPLPTAQALQDAITTWNTVISEHNTRSDEFDTVREQAKNKLLKHDAAVFAEDTSYKQTIKKIGDLRNEATDKSKKALDLEKECQHIEDKLSDSQKGARAVNAYLERFFGKKEIQIRAMGKGKFNLLRNDDLAKNLSSGERNAISLAYFIASLHQRGASLSQSIVVVDDPISSLDSNHLFNAYAMLRTELSTAAQVFILTHSFEFLTLLKEWIQDKDKSTEAVGKENARYYLLRGQDAGTPRLTELPILLRKFRSEYVYLFSLLYTYHQDPSQDPGREYSLTNVIRRFIDTFTAIKLPLDKPPFTKLRELTTDRGRILVIERFLTTYSHAVAGSTGITYPDMAELSTVIKAILDLLKECDKKHYRALISAVG